MKEKDIVAHPGSINPTLPSEYDRLRIDVEALTEHISPREEFQLGQVMELLNELGEHRITVNQVRYLQSLGLLRVSRAERGYYKYNRNHLRELLVIGRLHLDFRMPYSQIAGAMRDAGQAHQLQASSAAKPYGTLTNQVQRAVLFWRSHLFIILLAWLFDGSIPRFLHAQIRKRPLAGQSKAQTETRVEIRRCEFRDVADNLSETHAEDLALITTEDGEGPTQRDLLGRMEAVSEPGLLLVLPGGQISLTGAKLSDGCRRAERCRLSRAASPEGRRRCIPFCPPLVGHSRAPTRGVSP